MMDHNALVVRIIKMHGVSKQTPCEKIKRDAFIYLSGKDKQFAQCETCWLFNADKERCGILGPDFEVKAYASCTFYLKGDPPKDMKLVKRVSPKAAGYVVRSVRCENCKYGGDECQLYVMLNEKLPEVFDLDTKIEPRACCNAQTPK